MYQQLGVDGLRGLANFNADSRVSNYTFEEELGTWR